jgi:hypothetical protein
MMIAAGCSCPLLRAQFELCMTPDYLFIADHHHLKHEIKKQTQVKHLESRPPMGLIKCLTSKAK